MLQDFQFQDNFEKPSETFPQGIFNKSLKVRDFVAKNEVMAKLS